MTGHEAGITLNAKLTHRRTINSKYGTSDIQWLRKRIDPSAMRYEGKAEIQISASLDEEMAQQIRSLSKPYPNALRLGVHPGGAGVNPTVPLQDTSN